MTRDMGQVRTTYCAVPLAALAHELGETKAGALIARAADGFVNFIPGALALSTAAAGPRGWLAVEPPDHPWPALPGKARSAGPLRLIRDSASVRHWPEQRMPTVSKSALPDTDIEAVVRYLEYVANR